MATVLPTDYIVDTDPIDQAVPTIADWFEVKTHAVDNLGPDQLAWLFAQGWEVASMQYDTYGNGTGTLRRTEVKSQEILQDLIQDYISAYNEGRDLNDQRYDELVSIYQAIVADSQVQQDVLLADDTVYDGLIEVIITALGTDHTAYETDVDGDLALWNTSLTTRINLRFDNKLTSMQQSLVDRGMNNTTVWTSVATGIERERELALSDLADKKLVQELDLKHKVQDNLNNMRGRVLSARDRLRTTIHSGSDTRMASRNALITAMASFIERRTDSYPDLGQVGQLAAQLGTGSGNTFAP